jgi:hypothetical protein
MSACRQAGLLLIKDDSEMRAVMRRLLNYSSLLSNPHDAYFKEQEIL